MHFNLTELVTTIGYLGVFSVVFAESGLFFGFFLPGDSLLVTAGLLAQQGYFNILYFLLLLPIAAILGDSVGYWTGKLAGPKIFTQDRKLLNKRHLDEAHHFYEKYGGKTIILARFIPIIRTFAPIVAGAAYMDYREFLTYNVVGGILWTMSMVLLGYFLGQIIPDSEKYVLLIIAVIIVLSLLPPLIERFRQKRSSSHGSRDGQV